MNVPPSSSGRVSLPARAAWARRLDLLGQVGQGQPVGVLEDRDHEALLQGDGQADVDLGLDVDRVVTYFGVQARVVAQGQRGGPDDQVGDGRGVRPLFLELGAERHRGVHGGLGAQGELGHLVEAGVHPGGDDAAHPGQGDDLGACLRGVRGLACWPGVAAAAMSERRILPPGPVPVTAARSTPAAAASRRTSGETAAGRVCRGVCGAVVASRTSAVMMRPPGPVPASWVMSRPRSRATRRALGEENRRPLRGVRRCGGRCCGRCCFAGLLFRGLLFRGRPLAGLCAGGRFAGLQEPADQGAGREFGAGLDRRVEQAGSLGLDLDVHLVGGQPQQRVARLDRGAGLDQPLLDQPVFHGQPQLGDQDLDGHVSPRCARADAGPRPRSGWRPGCRHVRAPG